MTRTALAADPLDVDSLAAFADLLGSPLNRAHLVADRKAAEGAHTAALLAAYWLFVEHAPRTVVMAPRYVEARDVFQAVVRWAQDVPALVPEVFRIRYANGGELIETADSALSLAPANLNGARGMSVDRLVAINPWSYPPAVFASARISTMGRPDSQVWTVAA